MKPSPIVTGTICSACGLDWDRHDKKTLDTCVELLKADLAREKQRLTPQPVYPYQWTIRPFWNPNTNPLWQNINVTSSGTQSSQIGRTWNDYKQ